MMMITGHIPPLLVAGGLNPIVHREVSVCFTENLAYSKQPAEAPNTCLVLGLSTPSPLLRSDLFSDVAREGTKLPSSSQALSIPLLGLRSAGRN